MAETSITVTELELNTASADLPDGSGTVAATPADGWSVPVSKSHLMWFKLEGGAAAQSITFKAGEMPPAMRQGLGDLQVSLAINDVRVVAVDPSRFMRDDGTILAVTSGSDTRLSAFQLPFAGTAK